MDETELVPPIGVPQGQIGRSASPGDADGQRQYAHALTVLQERMRRLWDAWWGLR